MATHGRFANGDPYIVNPAAGNGVRISSMAPASTVGTITEHGAMVDPGVGSHDGPQGFSDNVTNSGPIIGYDAALNVDPGKTGSPLDFAAGDEGTIVKSVILPEPNNGRPFEGIGTLTVLGATPASDAFRPGVATNNKSIKWKESDILDLTTLPNLALLGTEPSVNSVLNAIRWKQQQEWFPGDNASSVAAVINQPRGAYPARAIGPAVNEACLLLCLDIPQSNKRDLAVVISQIAIDVFEFLENHTGGSYFGGINGPTGLGGVAARGFKQALTVGSLLLQDTTMQAWADSATNPLFVEDGQIKTVEQADIDATQTEIEGRPVAQYVQSDLGTPEWTASNWLAGADGNRHPNEAYRSINTPYYVQTALILHLFPGAKFAFNNQVLLDYVDRIMERDFLADNTDTLNVFQYARQLTGTDSLTAWELAMWDNYRSQGAAIWDWP